MVNYLEGNLKCLTKGVGVIQSRFTVEIENQITEPWDELQQLCIHALLIGPGTWDVLLHAVNLFVMRPC